MPRIYNNKAEKNHWNIFEQRLDEAAKSAKGLEIPHISSVNGKDKGFESAVRWFEEGVRNGEFKPLRYDGKQMMFAYPKRNATVVAEIANGVYDKIHVF